jgi:HlyD family secretion protein
VETELHKLRIDKADRAHHAHRSRWPVVILLILAMVLGGGWWGWQWRTAAAAPLVQTVRVLAQVSSTVETDRGSDVVLSATGYVTAAHKIELASKVLGRVSWVGVEMGDKIQGGQVLVRLEDDEYAARVAQEQGLLDNAKAMLAQLQAGSRAEEIASEKAKLDQMQAQLNNAQLHLQRLKQLSATVSVSRQEIDDAAELVAEKAAQVDWQQQQYALSKIGPRKEQIDAQAATVRELEGGLALAKIDLDDTVIRAPMNATVLQRNVEVGEFVTTGFVGDHGAKGYVLSIADLQDLRVELDISQNDFAKVASKQSCWIITDAYPDKKYQGIVDLISPEANRQKATIQVRVKVLNPDDLLKPEMNASVSFLSPRKSAAASNNSGAKDQPMIRIPATSIRDGAVFVVEGGKAIRRPVTTSTPAGVNAKDVEIRQGLIGGEDLIVSPPDSLQDGSPVKVADEKV